MRRRVGWAERWAACIMAILLFGACGEQLAVATPRPIALVIAGATSMHPALNELADEFMRRQPHIQIVLRGGGSTLGEEQAAAGRIDLAATTLFPPETGGETPDNTLPPRPHVVRTPIGIDAVAIVVHGSNDVTALSMQQLRDLFAGLALDWQELGGAPGEIALVSREEGSGTRHLFEERVMGEEPVSLTAVVMPTSEDVVDYVSKTPSAIGYVSRSWVLEPLAAAQAEVAEGAGSGGSAGGNNSGNGVRSLRVVSLDGTLPTLDALRAQSYPLIQPLYLASRTQPRGAARQFIDFVLSPAGQMIVGKYHLRVR